MAGRVLSWRRIYGVNRRHLYLLRRSWPRVVELIYYPTLQIVLWGFITRYLGQHSDFFAQAAGVFLSAVLLWHVVARAQRSVSLMFTEEVRSRHLGYLFVSPLRAHELVIALCLISITRILIGVGGAAVLAILIQRFSIFDAVGPSLILFFANLMWFGWSVALVISALLLRLGQGAESLTGVVVLLLQPLSGVYYPIATMPGWVQGIAWCLPTTPVFEGMRALMLDGHLRADLLIDAILLNLVWTVLGALIFMLAIKVARRRGLLLQTGE